MRLLVTLAVVVVAFWNIGNAVGQQFCPSVNGNCLRNESCCLAQGGADAYCIPDGYDCCAPASTGYCNSTQVCCTEYGCVGESEICCYGTACDRETQSCCYIDGEGVCVAKGSICCGDIVCPVDTQCCPNLDTGELYCSPVGGKCCGSSGCQQGEVCCPNFTCCSGQSCCFSG